MEIYAELNNNDLQKIDRIFSVLSNSVKTVHKTGSKFCLFECDNKEAFEEVADLLDANRINWQNNDTGIIAKADLHYTGDHIKAKKEEAEEETGHYYGDDLSDPDRDSLHLFGKKEKKVKKVKEDMWWDYAK